MPYHLQWFHRDHVIYTALLDDCPVEEVAADFSQILKMLDNAPGTHAIHVIGDSRWLNIQINELQLIKEITTPFFNHPRLGWTLLITDHPLHRFLGTITARLLNARWNVRSSLTDAREFLTEQDMLSESEWIPVSHAYFDSREEKAR
jgi:hypothetical protein